MGGSFSYYENLTLTYDDLYNQSSRLREEYDLVCQLMNLMNLVRIMEK